MTEQPFTTLATARHGDMAAVIDVAQQATEPRELDTEKVYGVIVPAGGTHVQFDLERYLPVPKRKLGDVSLNDAESFARYITKHTDEGATELYADVTRQSIIALLNDHTASVAGWGDHRATLELRQTPEWQIWTKNDGSMLAQVAFAELVEDNLPDIVDPDGATLLELSQSFQARTNVRFESAKRLQGGDRQLVYTEDVTATAGAKGDITIPATFTLGISPFEVGEAYSVVARLRYRITDGRLTLGYRLDRPADVLRSAFRDVVTEVQSRTGIDVLYGNPRRAVYSTAHTEV